jgi:hypothetical protein
MNIQGGCHCKNIRLTIEWPDTNADIPVRACDCSFCAKHGGKWTSHPDAKLTALLHDGSAVSRYRFGTKTADFHVCARCGVAALVTSTINGKLYAVVNVNAFDNVDSSLYSEKNVTFEGEDPGARLHRRKRNWITDVRIIQD